MENSLLNIITLTLLPGIGDVNAKRLIAYCGGVDAIFKEKKQQLLKIPGIGPKLVEALTLAPTYIKRAEKELQFIEKNKIKACFYLDDDYPRRLKPINDAPVLLYCKGNGNLNAERILGVVGTRRNTEYGKLITEKIVEHYKDTPTLILSGMAYGIDITAHKSALLNNLETIGVLAHGLDRIYPPTHTSIAEKMIYQGALITDFISGTKPDRENFPKRNRIVAGLCDALVVVEAAITGGALITAEIANSYNKDVFAVPGRATDEFSVGCNALIIKNKAHLVTSGADIDYFMGWENKPNSSTVQPELFVELNPQEEQLLQTLKEFDELTIDEIAIKTGLAISKVASSLLNMELNGIVRCFPGKRYKVI